MAAAGGTTSGRQTVEGGGVGVMDIPPGGAAGEEGVGGGDLPHEGAAAEVRGEGVQEPEGAAVGGAGEAEGGVETSPDHLHLFTQRAPRRVDCFLVPWCVCKG